MGIQFIKDSGLYHVALSLSIIAEAQRQEEALCYSSTLYATLKPSYYPWPNLGPGCIAGVFSPAVVIFKNDLDNDCADLPVDDRKVVSVITVAAPRGSRLTGDRLAFANASDLEDLRGKIRLVYRMAAHNGKTSLVLGEFRACSPSGNYILMACSCVSRCDGIRCLRVPSPCCCGRDEIDIARPGIRRVVPQRRLCCLLL